MTASLKTTQEDSEIKQMRLMLVDSVGKHKHKEDKIKASVVLLPRINDLEATRAMDLVITSKPKARLEVARKDHLWPRLMQLAHSLEISTAKLTTRQQKVILIDLSQRRRLVVKFSTQWDSRISRKMKDFKEVTRNSFLLTL